MLLHIVEQNTYENTNTAGDTRVCSARKMSSSHIWPLLRLQSHDCGWRQEIWRSLRSWNNVANCDSHVHSFSCEQCSFHSLSRYCSLLLHTNCVVTWLPEPPENERKAAMVAENGEEKEKWQDTQSPKNKHPPDRAFHRPGWDPKELKIKWRPWGVFLDKFHLQKQELDTQLRGDVM